MEGHTHYINRKIVNFKYTEWDAYGVSGETMTHGQVIYRDGKIDMVLFPGGYATVEGSEVTFHYYTQDYLGNNRAVINGTTGAVEQTVAYYPYWKRDA